LIRSQLTWADLFLAPIFADMMALESGRQLLESSFPRLVTWFGVIRARPSFEMTHDGTLLAQRTW
jgi:glutathione S-transferase